jgi:hypothetical protein
MDNTKKYNVLENILQKVNQKYIAAPDDEIKRNNRLLEVRSRQILLLVLTRRVSGRRQDHPDDAQQEHPLRQLVPEQVLRRQLLRQPQSRESLRVRPGLPPVSTESCRTHNRGQRCARVRPRDPQHGSPLQEKRRSSQIPVSCSCFASQLSTTPHLSTEVWKVFSTVIDCVQRKLSHGWRV